MNLKNRLILEDYRKSHDAFIKLESIVDDKLKKIVKDSKIFIMGIEHRVKSEKSLAGKLERYGDYYQSFDQLTDILGARLICFFADEVDILGKMIEKEFEIDWDLSSDKRKLIETHTFGYLSLHYICYLPFNAGYPDEVCGKKFEIQVRTNLQHTWAQIEHDLGYKNEFGVPRVVARNFARIAGMLELIDDEFVRTRDLMINYTESVREKIIENKADDVLIDTVSLTEYVNKNKKMQEFLSKIAEVCHAEISEVDLSGYVEQFAWFKIKTLGGLQKLMDERGEKALSLAISSLENTELDILSSNIGLRYLLRSELISGKYTEEQAVDMLTVALGDVERAKKQAKFLFRKTNK